MTKRWRKAWGRANHLAFVANHLTDGGQEEAGECLAIGTKLRKAYQTDYYHTSCEWTDIAASLALDGAPISELP